jgi:hypothetical protein
MNSFIQEMVDVCYSCYSSNSDSHRLSPHSTGVEMQAPGFVAAIFAHCTPHTDTSTVAASLHGDGRTTTGSAAAATAIVAVSGDVRGEFRRRDQCGHSVVVSLHGCAARLDAAAIL